jgi:hypothetical protein
MPRTLRSGTTSQLVIHGCFLDLIPSPDAKGGVGCLGVLVADRSLFAGQQALIGVRLAEQVNLVTLYKALGGAV